MKKKQPIIIACANQKGGVAKTTTAIHVAVALRRIGKTVALFDLDLQGNATLCLVQELGRSRIRKLGEEGNRWKSAEGEGGLEILQPLFKASRDSLTQAIRALGDMDYIVLDCPPSLTGWSSLALSAARHVLIPLQCDFLAMQGLAQILKRIQEHAARDQRLEAHVLPVMVEPEKQFQQEILADVRENLPAELCQVWIPRDPQFGEAASHGLSLFRYNARSAGARSYANLLRELRHGWT